MNYKKFFDYLKENVGCGDGTWHPSPDFNASSFIGRRHVAFDENLRFGKQGKRLCFNPHIYVYPSKTELFDNAKQVFEQKAAEAFRTAPTFWGNNFSFDKYFKWGGKKDADGHLYGAVVNIFVPISAFDFNRLSDGEKAEIVRAYQVLVDSELAIGIRNEDFNKKNRGTISTKGSDVFSSRNLIVFGAPGTGKSHYLDGERVKKKKDVIEDSDSEESYFARCERVTFYPTYSYAQFVGSYKPVMKEVDKDGIELGPAKNDEHTRKAIAYEFVPGPFLRILKDAWRNQDKNYLLIIEEINRANAAAVFGDVFQLLDRNNDNGESVYSISPSREMIEYLRRKSSDGRDGVANDVALKLRIPSNLYIWATMNSADQGVFPLDTAFKRRWDFKYRSLDDNTSNDGVMVVVGDYICKWGALRKAINEVLKRSRVSEDKMLSSSFVCPDIISVGRVKEVISAERFEMKVLMYLWEDAARMCRQNVFSDDVKVLSDLIKAWNGARFDDVEEPDPEGKKPKRGVLRAGLNLGDTKFDFFEKEKPAEDKGQEEDAEPQPPPQEKPAEAHAEAPAAQAPAAEAPAAEGKAGEEEKEAHPAEETDKGQKKGEEPQVKD